MGTDGDEPFIAMPDAIDDDPRNGLMCWLHDMRMCGPDCMAYTTQPADVQSLGPQQRHCTLIVGVERLSRHGVIIAKVLNDAAKVYRDADIDRRREQQRPPSAPR